MDAHQPVHRMLHPRLRRALRQCVQRRAGRAGVAADKVRAYLEATVMPTLRGGLRAMCRAKPADPHAWLADFLLAHRPGAPAAT